MNKRKLKEAYGLGRLSFYQKGYKFYCRYSDEEDLLDFMMLDFILRSLSVQQGVVYFDDVGEECIGIDQLKHKYLIFKLAGL